LTYFSGVTETGVPRVLLVLRSLSDRARSLRNKAIGKLESVPLRELWKHEERGFSAWLEDNLDVLSETLGISLSDPKRESLAANFQMDLIARRQWLSLLPYLSA
jgi:hypothetical protein